MTVGPFFLEWCWKGMKADFPACKLGDIATHGATALENFHLGVTGDKWIGKLHSFRSSWAKAAPPDEGSSVGHGRVTKQLVGLGEETTEADRNMYQQIRQLWDVLYAGTSLKLGVPLGCEKGLVRWQVPIVSEATNWDQEMSFVQPA